MTTIKEISLEQLRPQRKVSQNISGLLQKRLNQYLDVLTQLFSPRMVLGEYMQSAFSERVPGAEQRFAKLEEKYKELAGGPFKLPGKLATPLPNIRNQLVINPWEFPYQPEGMDEEITVSSPVKWVLGYRSGYSLNEWQKDKRENQEPSAEQLRSFLLASLTMWLFLEQADGIKSLLADLRFPISIQYSALTGSLPLAVIEAQVPSMRPQDSVISTVAQLSGKPVFEELIDTDQLEAIKDPLLMDLTALRS